MHRDGFPVEDPPFDLLLVYGLREEKFPLQALADFARLGSWLLSPDEILRIEWAAKTAVARAVRDTFKGLNWEVETDEDVDPYLARVQEAHFSLEAVTFGLLRFPGLGHWDDTWDGLSTRADVATSIASTLLQLDRHSPDGYRPSMSRAIHRASFSGEFHEGVSRETARDIWETYGPSAPFLLAERWISFPEIEPDEEAFLKRLMFLSPSDKTFYQFFQIMRDARLIQKLLSNARFIQSELQRILGDIGATPVAFVDFPDEIPILPVDIPIFSAPELILLRDYRAANR